MEYTVRVSKIVEMTGDITIEADNADEAYSIAKLQLDAGVDPDNEEEDATVKDWSVFSIVDEEGNDVEPALLTAALKAAFEAEHGMKADDQD
jgi:hypothetical protein